MAKIIAQCIDNAILILVVVLLLRYYFKPNVKLLYRKKWVLVGCILMILYSVVEFGLTCRECITSRIPLRESVENTIQDSGQTDSEDFIFSSEDGYHILIPSGYTYVSSQAGGLSLTATRDNSAFLVLKMHDPASLDRIMDAALSAMQKRNPTLVLDSRRNMLINRNEAVRIDCSATKNNIQARQILVLCQKGDTLFQLTFSCPRTLFEELKSEYEAILTSFKFN